MPEDEHDQTSGLGRDTALVAAAGAGAAAGFLIGGGIANPMAAAASSQAAVAAMSRTWDAISSGRRRRASAPFAYAAHTTGTSVGEINEVLISDPERLRLATAIIDAAMDAGLDEKLVELGRILVDAIGDDAQLDLDWLIVDALAVVEAPHLKVLAKFGAVPQSVQQDWFPQLGVGLTPILRALAAKGLVREVVEIREMNVGQPSVIPGQGTKKQSTAVQKWQRTDFGEEVMTRLQQAAEEVARIAQLGE